MISLLLTTAITIVEPSAPMISSVLAHLDRRIDDGLMVCLKINGSDPDNEQLPPPVMRADVYPASQCRYINHQIQAPNGRQAALLSLDNFKVLTDRTAELDARLLHVAAENSGAWSITLDFNGAVWNAVSEVPTIDLP